MSKIFEMFGKRRLALWGFSALFLLIMAAVLIFAIQSASSPEGLAAGWKMADERTKVYLLSSFVLFLMMLVLTMIIRRPILTVTIVAALVRVLSSISLQKYLVRGMWLLPEDLRLASQAGELAGMVNIGGIIRMFALTLLIVVVGVFANKVFEKWRQEWMVEEPELTKKTAWSLRGGVIVACTALFFSLSSWALFPKQGNFEDAWIGTTVIKWNQVDNYTYNGMFFGFLSNIKTGVMEKPEGWTKDATTEIANKYQERSASENAGRDSLTDEDINILFVMNESFFDPAVVYDYYPHSGGDVTPNLHALQEYALSRTMFSPEYGGSTANIEFEALTGLTNYWFGGIPFTDTLSRRNTFPSVASLLGGMGYQTIGMHPFNGEFYKRSLVYKHLGFEEFYDQKIFTDYSTAGGSSYISDASAYEMAMDILEQDEQKKFMTLVTMQNHTPYDTTFEEAELQFRLEEKHDNGDAIEGYLQTLHISDEALGELIERIGKSDKKIVLVLWGDHSPGIWNDLVNTENDALVHQTPLVIWKNYEENGEIASIPDMVSPNQIANVTFDVLGAQKPYMYYLLDDVMRVAPVLARPYRNVEEDEALRDYKFINYSLFANKAD